MTTVIRRATPADADAVAGLVRQLNAQQGDPTEHFTTETLIRDGFGDDATITVLVAELDVRLVGYALMHVAYESAWAARGLYLADLFVVPDARRRGIGRALIAAAAREARDQERSYLWWASKPWNDEARAFFDALGAVTEPVNAHALTFDAFDALAGEAVRQDG